MSPRSHPCGPCVQANPQCMGFLHLSGLSRFSCEFRKQNQNIQPALWALRASIERRQHPNIDICWNPWHAKTAAGSLSRRAQSSPALALRGHGPLLGRLQHWAVWAVSASGRHGGEGRLRTSAPSPLLEDVVRASKSYSLTRSWGSSCRLCSIAAWMGTVDIPDPWAALQTRPSAPAFH